MFLIFYILKKKKYVNLMFQKLIQIDCEKQITLLMILNEEKETWLYLALKKLSPFFKRINIKTPRWFLLFKLSSFFCNKKKLKCHEKLCKNKGFCGIVMS